MGLVDIFSGKKKKELEKEKQRQLEERQQHLDSNIEHSNRIQEETKDTQKGTLEIIRQNYELNERLTMLVAENKEKENILLEKENLLIKRENGIKISENDIEERINAVRKEEIVLEARRAEIRKEEQIVSENDKNVKAREEEAQKLKLESEEAQEKYQNLYDVLESQKENISLLEKEAIRKNNDATEKEVAANAIFEKARTIDDEIKVKEAEFKSKREDIEASLKTKIDEYDRKLDDINNVQAFIDNIKFDDSEDGKAAKIVVKETIRLAKKSLADAKTQFDELDEKYCGGTFKGFSTPISEIDKTFEDLKIQYEQIKEHIASNSALPNSINDWLDSIENYINNADKSIKSWEFSEGYRNIIFGLSACKHYELLLTILNEWAGNGTSSEEESTAEEEFVDWYEVLDVNPDASTKEIKKRYRELAKQFHPDIAIDDEEKHEFEEKMQLLNRAYEILKNEGKRKEFDEKRKAKN